MSPSSKLRDLFPTLDRSVGGKRLVYLDTASTSLRPTSVIDAEAKFYRDHNASAHRGLYTLAEEATELYEGCREAVGKWLDAPSPESVVFTRNATAGLNLVARGVEHLLSPGDEILLTEMEHHSNLVPWIQLSERKPITLRHVSIKPDGTLDMDEFRRLLTPRTKLVSLTHSSNVLGTINPVAEVALEARKVGAWVIVDAAQSAGRLPLSFKQLGVDGLVVSAHKCYGPMGLGFFVGSPELLEALEPFEGGGQMIERVTLDSATWAKPPHKFEAGTANVASTAAFPAALSLMSDLGEVWIRNHEIELTAYTMDRLSSMSGFHVLGPENPEARVGLISFSDTDIHPHDLATLVNECGVALRAGHHCAQPLHRKLGLAASVRVSFGVYSERDDVDALIDALGFARRYLSR